MGRESRDGLRCWNEFRVKWSLKTRQRSSARSVSSLELLVV